VDKLGKDKVTQLTAERYSYLYRVQRARQEWHDNQPTLADELLEQCAPELRHWEWHYIKRLCHAELQAFPVGNDVRSFTSDGGFAATVVYFDRSRLRACEIQVVELKSRRVVFSAPNDANTGIFQVTFSPDDKIVACGSGDGLHYPGEVRAWEWKTGRQVFSFYDEEGPSYFPRLAYSPDSNCLASIYIGEHHHIVIWNATGEQIRILDKDDQRPGAIAFSPDNRLLAAGYGDGVVLWDLMTGTPGEAIPIDGTDLLRFSRDGQRLAVVSQGGEAGVVVEPLAGLLGFSLSTTGFPKGVVDIAFSPDGRVLASANRDRSITIWDGATGERQYSLHGHQSDVRRIAYSADGRTLLSADAAGLVKVWEPSDPEVRTIEAKTGQVLCFSPNLRRMAVANDEENKVEIRELETHRLCCAFTVDLPGRPSAFSADGKLFAWGNDERTVTIWNTDSGAVMETLSVPNARAEYLAFSLDGKYLAAAYAIDRQEAEELLVWDVVSGKIIHRFAGHTDYAYVRDFSRDGRRLASTNRGIPESSNVDDYRPEIRVWDLPSGKEFPPMLGHRERIDAISFSPDSNRLASGGPDGVRIWEVETAGEIRTLCVREPSSVCFSPDGERLLVGGGDRIRIYDTSAFEETLCLSAFWDHVSFSSDGRHIAARAYDSIQIRDAAPVGPKAAMPHGPGE
jgi:WD40 repeat protein